MANCSQNRTRTIVSITIEKQKYQVPYPRNLFCWFLFLFHSLFYSSTFNSVFLFINFIFFLLIFLQIIYKDIFGGKFSRKIRYLCKICDKCDQNTEAIRLNKSSINFHFHFFILLNHYQYSLIISHYH